MSETTTSTATETNEATTGAPVKKTVKKAARKASAKAATKTAKGKKGVKASATKGAKPSKKTVKASATKKRPAKKAETPDGKIDKTKVRADFNAKNTHRIKDVDWTAAKVEIFKALKALKANSATDSVTIKSAALKAGVRPQLVRHYVYHAKAAGLTNVVPLTDGHRGYGVYLTKKGQALNLVKLAKEAKTRKTADKAE